jgi:hypothetical protein
MKPSLVTETDSHGQNVQHHKFRSALSQMTLKLQKDQFPTDKGNKYGQ